MPKKEACCVDPADARVIFFDGPWAPPPAPIYTVPAGKVFVLTAWTQFPWNFGDNFLYRDGAPVAYCRPPNNVVAHQTYPDGIVFTAGQIVGGTIAGGGIALIYGHEIDG